MKAPFKRISPKQRLICTVGIVAESNVCYSDAEFIVWGFGKNKSEKTWQGAAACLDHLWEVVEKESTYGAKFLLEFTQHAS